MKKVFILLALAFLCISANAQNKIKGKITDQDNKPLAGATIYLSEINKGTITDKDGFYEVNNLPNGKFRIQFSFVGYINTIETAVLTGESYEVNVALHQSAIEVDELVVTGGYNSTQHENAVKIDAIKINSITSKATPNFTEQLTKIAGVDMISKGSGVSKPVIRGLSMNDILVLNNGVRFENYQYSSHHPLGIDEFGIEDVEVIKGPASLLYGSDAIGGVINFIKEKPAPIGSIIVDYNMQLFSNSLGMTNNIGIKGASKHFFGGVRFGQKTNADYLQGGGNFVPNSRFNEMSLKANAGFTNKIGTFNLFYDYGNQKLGLVEDEAIDEIKNRGRNNDIWYQELNTHLISSQNKLYLSNYKVDINGAYQNTELIHFGDANVYEIQMQLETFTYETKIHLPSKTSNEYIIGFQDLNQINTNLNDRKTKLLPNANTNNYSAFGLLQFTFFNKIKFQTGVRYDIKSISTKAIGTPTDLATYRPAINKDYGSFSGSIGATYNMTDALLFRANIASAYRTPNLAELTSNGVHELIYEIGDKNLIPENSYETDLSIHLHKDNFSFEIAGFYNNINNYIFISPTGITAPTGESIYKYKQAKSYLYGGEVDLHIHPKSLEWLHLETSFASVIGKQKNGNYLPFVPAHKLSFEVRAEKEKLSFLHNAFISANSSTAFDQNNAAPDETKTSGYTLIDLSIGASLKVQNQLISITLGANNILDTKYIDHLSTLKEVNLNNPGRNISMTIKVPFGIKSN